MSDGGMQWFAEVGQWEQEQCEEQGRKDAAALEAHRQWMREFESGLPITSVKNDETNQQTEKTI
jgi:hypothetical protein